MTDRFARAASTAGVWLAVFALTRAAYADVLAPPSVPPAPTPSGPTAGSAPAAPTKPAPGGATTPAPVATVALTMADDRPYVDAMIDGHGPYKLLIDSGSETMIVTSAVATACRLPTKTGTVAVAGTSGAFSPVPQAVVDTVAFGSAVVADPFCTVAASLPADGVIGAPLFNAFVVQIDPAASQVLLWRPGDFRPSVDDLSAAITFGAHRVPVVQGAVCGIPATFEIDTGSTMPVELVPNFVAAHKLTDTARKVGAVAVASATGASRDDVYAVTGVQIDTRGAAIGIGDAVPAVFLDPNRPEEAWYDGRIGAPALDHFLLTFDYPASEVFFRIENAPAPAAPAPAQAPASTPSP